MATINLPNSWEPRPYQRPAWSYLEGGGKRLAVAWHRRAGKDDIVLHWAAVAAFQRVGGIWHMLPQASQARKAIWQAVNPHTGKRRIDEAFPPIIRRKTNDQEMFIEFVNGSTWQVVGSDNYDSLVGSPPVGVVFSEWSRANPAAWAYIRPILRENGGWAAFISTFLGRNHHYDLVKNAMSSPEWYGEILSAEETSVFTPEDLELERLEYIQDYGREEGEALFRQEYLSDPTASILGAFYGSQMYDAEKQSRLTSVPYDRSAPVFTGWDLGTNDVTAIWFAQQVGLEPRIIDYYQNSNQDIAHYAGVLKEKGYSYGAHYLPHDGGNKSVHVNKSVEQLLRDMGVNNVVVTRRAQSTELFLGDINETRKLITKAVFDAKRCEQGIEALRNYRREWDDKLKQYKKTPLHDWASDGADALRTLAVNWRRVEAETMGGFDMAEWQDAVVA